MKPDPVPRLHRVRGAEDRCDYRDDIHQGHANDPEHVFPTTLKSLRNGGSPDSVGFAFFGKGWRFRNIAANEITGNDHYEAEQKWDSPSPGIECVLGKITRQR